MGFTDEEEEMRCLVLRRLEGSFAPVSSSVEKSLSSESEAGGGVGARFRRFVRPVFRLKKVTGVGVDVVVSVSGSASDMMDDGLDR